eukprot:9500233-Pyramimonas_sp.AAC.2
MVFIYLVSFTQLPQLKKTYSGIGHGIVFDIRHRSAASSLHSTVHFGKRSASHVQVVALVAEKSFVFPAQCWKQWH